MKKLLTVMLTALFTFGIFSTAVLANGNHNEPAGMKDAVEERLSGLYYDFKEGSVHLAEVETFTVIRTVEEKVTNEKTAATQTVVTDKEFTYVAAVAHYETVRDDFYITSHSKIVYYEVETGKAVGKESLADVDGIADYQAKHKDALSTHMHWGLIFFVNLLVVIIPVVILVIWLKRAYSTTEYQIANNILGQNQSFN
ncbi:hypothetical protein CIB95_13365 [Lottiidibacillus patelloidae]|uniref:Uncharacterized protein n=1 Tax=Lottiidibacillus patelloidae TaxID=2670334 RepID=A0A263BR89_9BACI|nr:hypothetical protein [Lottiidibacillus patelloidae]OZM56092.1 hypothetical protein CIB95_13365 [Lottiidibacillus patelloidae]